MRFTAKLVASYVGFTERSQAIRTIVYGLTAFAIIFGIDMLWQLGGLSWYRGQLLSDALEAILLAVVASHLSRLREERILRREREMGYLNHHVRNSLAIIQMSELQVGDTDKRANALRAASRRICTVLEQLSRNEDVFIDDKIPKQYEKGRKSA